MPRKQPAIDFKGWGVSLKISEKGLDTLLKPVVTAGIVGIGVLAALFNKHSDIVEGIIKGVLEAAGRKVVNLITGSIIVEVQCTTKKSFLAFMEDFKTKKLKQQLEEEFQKQLEYKGELEVTIINEKEVYKELNQLRQLKVVAEKEEGLMSVKTGVGGSPVEGASSTEQCTSKRTAAEAFEDPSTSKGTSSAVPPPPKRKASEAFKSSLSEVAAAPKRKISFSSKTGDSMEIVTDKKFDADVMFALDSSSAVSDKEFQMELDFAKQMAASFSIPLKAIAYGDDAVSFHPDDTRPKFGGRGRRMDLALIQAAESLNPSSGQKKLIVLISAGRQASGLENKQDDVDLFVSTYKELTSRDIKVVIVPVTLHEEPDFRELGLLVKRPQSLYPLDSFDGFTSDTATKIAFNIKKTFDVEAYTKERFDNFSEIPQDVDLWENMSLCSDVLEGAWYYLYDDKKDTRPQKVKKAIRESVDSLQSTLVTESKINLLLAVFGNQGKGKSFILNSLLNWDLPDDCGEENAPLPSAFGDSQTPLPIYVKYGKYVEVVLRDEENDSSPVVWFRKGELENGTLRQVKSLLETKFQDAKNLPKSGSLELKGPFPVFRYLKQRTVTASGHLELDVDLELMDLPGSGSKFGDASITDHLSKADVVLFFNSNEAGRPVSPECISQVFRSHKGFEYTSRPKLVHIVNDKGTPSIACDFNSLQNEKKNDLKEAWDRLFDTDAEDEEIRRYKDVRSKLPKRDGEDLLEKMKEESDLLYFHTANAGFFRSLKKVVSDHVQSVILKQKIHPVLQGVHWAAKKLKARTKDALYTEKKRKTPVPPDPITTSFEMKLGKDKVSKLVASFMNQANLYVQSDFDKMFPSLYKNFLYCRATMAFLLDLVRKSLVIFANDLIYDFTSKNFAKLGGIPPDITNLVEMVSKTRIVEYYSYTAPGYVRQVLGRGRALNLFGDDEKTRWSSSSTEEREVLCEEILFRLLDGTVKSLEKGGRGKEETKSCFEFSLKLKEEVTELLAFRSNGSYSRTDTLQTLQPKLAKVVKFCVSSIREINPHPSLNVKATTSLPDKMVNAHADNEKPLVCSHEKIVREMTELLRKLRGKGKRRSKKEDDVIYQLETKLKIDHGQLGLHELQNVDRRFWEWSLVNVLTDKHHFDLKLASDLLAPNRQDTAAGKKLLSLARERLFAYERSCVTCKIVSVQSLQPFAPTGGNTGDDNEDGGDDNDQEYSPGENEIHVQKSQQEKNSLEALVSPQMSAKLDAIRDKFKDPSHHLAPIFIPVVRPGPTSDMQGNYFLDEDLGGKSDREEGEDEKSEEGNEKSGQTCDLNIFLVVEPRHLKIVRAAIRRHRHPQGSNVNLIVLPQGQRGIGVSKAIIKIVAECLNFSLYWTIDDDVQFMFEFDTNDRRWHKCSFTRGLLFGQRVFQTCLTETVKELSLTERFTLFSEVTSKWPDFAKETKANAAKLLIDDSVFAEVQKNPSLFHQPFKSIAADSDGDPLKVKELKALEMEFVEKCRKGLFEDSVNYIAGVSIAHEKTKKCDFTSKYPASDYMRSDQGSQVVLNNAYALRGRNFVTDDVIFHDEFEAADKDKLNSPYWGITGSEKSFIRSLTVSGVASYMVIRIIYAQMKTVKSRRFVEEDNDDD